MNPDFPSDVPDGIALVTDSFIPSPSNLGIDLGQATFLASFQGQEGASFLSYAHLRCITDSKTDHSVSFSIACYAVGPITASNLVLAPLASTSAHLTGTIIKRTSAESTASLGVLFSQFLAGQNQTLQVAGQSIVSPAQPGSPVSWLSAAFKKLILPVVLPGYVHVSPS